MRSRPAARTLVVRIFVLLAILAAVLTAQFAWAGGESCIAARIDAPVVLPDGTSHAAGVLRICLARSYSPVAGLHRTSVGGTAVGMYVSRLGFTEGSGDREQPYFLFLRTPNGELELLGYTRQRGDVSVTYALAGRKVRSHWMAGSTDLEEVTEQPKTMLLAANLN